MVAHRLSTLDHCDLLVEIAGGRLRVARGATTSGGRILRGA